MGYRSFSLIAILCLCSFIHQVFAVSQGKSSQTCQVELELIRHYFSLGYKYKEILAAHICIHGIKISYRHLKRLLKRMSLCRKGPESLIEPIINAILKEMSGSGRCLGYKSMWKRLKDFYGLKVRRITVLRLMWLADPEGMHRRKAKRLLRRQCSCPGPDFIWHIDGYDKIKPFGFAIHGAVDGFSRKLIWLELGPSNNDPKIISRYFLNAVKDGGFRVPEMIRSDLGTENTIIQQLQIYFRYRHHDDHSADKSFIKGKSTSNQRIECIWSFLRRQCLDFWISFFKDLRDTGVYCDGDIFQRQCLVYCFTPIIRRELATFANAWNTHDISKGKTDGPRGRPNIMYTLPELYNTRSYSHSVNSDEVNVCKEMYSKPLNYQGCFPEFYRLFQLINPTMPTSTEEALDLYVEILCFIRNNL